MKNNFFSTNLVYASKALTLALIMLLTMCSICFAGTFTLTIDGTDYTNKTYTANNEGYKYIGININDSSNNISAIKSSLTPESGSNDYWRKFDISKAYNKDSDPMIITFTRGSESASVTIKTKYTKTSSSTSSSSSSSSSTSTSTSTSTSANGLGLSINNSKPFYGKNTKENIYTFDFASKELVVTVTGSSDYKVSGVTGATVAGQKITVPLSAIKKAGASKSLTVKDKKNSKLITTIKLVRGDDPSKLDSFTLKNGTKEFTSKTKNNVLVEIKDDSPITFTINPTPSAGKLTLKETDSNVKNGIISINSNNQLVVKPSAAMLKSANKITTLTITDKNNSKAKVKVYLKYVPTAGSSSSSSSSSTSTSTSTSANGLGLSINNSKPFYGKNTKENIYTFDFAQKELVVDVSGSSDFKVSGITGATVAGQKITVPLSAIKKAGASKSLTVKDKKNSKLTTTVKLVRGDDPSKLDSFTLKNGTKEFTSKTKNNVFVEIKDDSPITFTVNPTPSTGKLTLKETDSNVKKGIISINSNNQLVVKPSAAMLKTANKITTLTITDSNNSKAKVKVYLKYVK